MASLPSSPGSWAIVYTVAVAHKDKVRGRLVGRESGRERGGIGGLKQLISYLSLWLISSWASQSINHTVCAVYCKSLSAGQWKCQLVPPSKLKFDCTSIPRLSTIFGSRWGQAPSQAWCDIKFHLKPRIQLTLTSSPRSNQSWILLQSQNSAQSWAEGGASSGQALAEPEVISSFTSSPRFSLTLPQAQDQDWCQFRNEIKLDLAMRMISSLIWSQVWITFACARTLNLVQ